MEPSFADALVTQQVIRCYYRVYNRLGHGFLESVYEGAMAHECAKVGLEVVRQAPLPAHYDEVEVGFFRADLLVSGRVVVALKAARAIEPAHLAQVINYLKASDLQTGLLLNFGTDPEVRRLHAPGRSTDAAESREQG